MKRIVLGLCLLVAGPLSAVTQAELRAVVDPDGLCASITFASAGAWAAGDGIICWMLGRGGENVEILRVKLRIQETSRFSCQSSGGRLRLDGNDWGYYYGANLVLERGEHELCFYESRVRAEDCLTFGPFRLEKSQPLFSVRYHPQGGSCDVETQEYYAGDRYEMFPEATMPGCSLVGWSTDPWDRWNLVTEDAQVYSWMRHLYAVWEVKSPETFVDPNNAFELWSSVDFDGEPSYEYAGHEDPEDGTWVYEPRICYLSGTARSEELIGGFVNRPGTIVFERCACQQRMAFLVDGEESERSRERHNCCSGDDYVFDRVKIRQGGGHEFALVAEDVNGGSSARFELGKMRWEPAPATVDVTFEACGGTASQASKRFQTGLAYKVLPTATRAGATFVGWFTQQFGGEKVEASDRVDWDNKTLYAHWRHADLVQAMGAGVRNVTTSDAELWTGENGVTLTPTNAEDRTVYWLEANCAGEAVFSFDWVSCSQTLDEEVRGVVEVAFYVDGVRQDVSGDDYVTLTYQPNGGGSFSAYLAPGEHRLRWEVLVPCLYGVEAKVIFGNFKKETNFASSIWNWGRFLYDYRIWRTGTLPALQTSYAAKFAQTEDGYRAMIEHALTTLALLGEDPIVSDTLRKFGFDLSAAPLAISGALTFDRAPEGNALVDAAFSKIEPAIRAALSDLERIPESWRGKILCSAEEFSLDTNIYVDFADVAFVRAILKAALATASWVKAYNTVVDYEILRNDMSLSASALAVYGHQAHVFDKVRDMSALRTAKACAKEALQLTQLADARVLARGPGEFLFNYDEADDDLLQKSRQKVAEALRSLATPVDVDLSGLLPLRSSIPQMNPLCVDLGAIFAGKVTRALVPPFEDEETFSPDLSRLPDATFGGALPGMTQNAWRELADAYEWFPAHYTIEFSRGSAPYVSDRMDHVKCGCHRVVRLPECSYIYPGKRFAGWACSNGRRYDDGMLVFNLAEPGETVTMTAIWE